MEVPVVLEQHASLDSDKTEFDSQAIGDEASGWHLNTPQTTSEFRNRSNSEVEYDIITKSPRQKQNILPALVQDYEHDRGLYHLPDVTDEVIPVDEYSKPSREPSEIFIYNYETFPKSSPRKGTRLDVRALIETFGRLKFNVSKERIFNNETRNGVLATIQTATSNFDVEDPKKPINCLIVIFLTHGLANNVIEVADDIMTVEEIIHKFNDCKALQDVPKWFTFLACKERKNDYRVNRPNLIVSDQTYINRLPDDVILYYSTTEDNISARRRNEGTWVIQELCKALQAYGRRDEVIDILTRTNKCIANNYVANDNFRQCPVILSTLTKKFFLTLSKDRVAQLTILKTIQDLNAHIINNQ